MDRSRGSWSRGRRVWQRKGTKVEGDMKRDVGDDEEDNCDLNVDSSDFMRLISDSEGNVR